MLQGCRVPVFEEVEEGLDGRQPDIACHRRVFALILKMFQEGTDDAGVELLEIPLSPNRLWELTRK